MRQNTEAQVVFPGSGDERMYIEMSSKGWISATVHLSNGVKYEVYFSDPIRLKQDLEANIQYGKPYFAEPGLIVLPEVTIEAIHAAVNSLVVEGFFTSLLPVKE